MNRRHRTSKGQALVLVTLSLFAMTGLMGLAVDLGWSFFVKKEAQAAADAAALGAVREAQARMGGSFSGFTCPGSPGATTPWCDNVTTLECSSGNINVGNTSNLGNGCLYAARNGFSHSVNSRQTVWIQANDGTSMPPGLTSCTSPGSPAPCYDHNGLVYWVKVRVDQTVPQLFSAVLGNTQSLISATATAAIVSSVVPGQFIALNQPGTAMNVGSGGSTRIAYGEDVHLGGSGSLSVPGGIDLDSTCTSSAVAGCTGVGTVTGGSSSVCSGSGCPSVGNGSVTIPVAGAAAGANVSPTPVVGPATTDPFQGVPQPPLSPASSSIGSCGIPGGTINGGSGSTPLILGPFQYYSVNARTGVPDGNPITLNGNIAFDPNSTVCSAGSAGIASPAGSAATGAFSAFYFYGGISLSGATIYFGPGQYVMVGTNSSTSGQLFGIGPGSSPTITGSGTGTGTGVNPPATVPTGVTADTGAGTMFIFTNPSYSAGLGASPPASVSSLVTNLGSFDDQGGNTTSISLAGIDRDVASVPASLGQYNGLLMWQDRADSTMELDSLGNITYPAGCPGSSTTACNPNTPTPSTLNAETMQFQAHPNEKLGGVIYQPQGASVSFTGGGSMTAALQIITGGVVLQGSANISLTSVQNSSIEYIVALIQ